MEEAFAFEACSVFRQIKKKEVLNSFCIFFCVMENTLVSVWIRSRFANNIIKITSSFMTFVTSPIIVMTLCLSELSRLSAYLFIYVYSNQNRLFCLYISLKDHTTTQSQSHLRLPLWVMLPCRYNVLRLSSEPWFPAKIFFLSCTPH